MEYRKLKDGTHAVGFMMDDRFIPYATAFDGRVARALIKAIHSVLDLFHATSGAWVTMVGDNEIPRGASSKKKSRKK
jgi:hypothetical protein